MPLHVSSTVVLIIRRSKLYYTASGIVTPVGGRPVRRLREDFFLYKILLSSCMYSSDSGWKLTQCIVLSNIMCCWAHRS